MCCPTSPLRCVALRHLSDCPLTPNMPWSMVEFQEGVGLEGVHVSLFIQLKDDDDEQPLVEAIDMSLRHHHPPLVSTS